MQLTVTIPLPPGEAAYNLAISLRQYLSESGFRATVVSPLAYAYTVDVKLNTEFYQGAEQPGRILLEEAKTVMILAEKFLESNRAKA